MRNAFFGKACGAVPARPHDRKGKAGSTPAPMTKNERMQKMNVEKIKKRCMKYGTCVLITNEDQQWIGTDEALYPVEGVRLSAASIAGIFGLNRDEKDNLQIREEDNHMTELALYPTIRETDEPCEIEAWTINAIGGEIGQAVGKITGRRVWFWMDAMRAAKKKGEVLDGYMRGNNLVFTSGMLVDAVIGTLGEGIAEGIRKTLERMIEISENPS